MTAKKGVPLFPLNKSGYGTVALGNGFNTHTDLEAHQIVEAAWNAGVRYFDTAPLYGLGISERRLGLFLKDKPRKEYVLSSKVGRLLEPKDHFRPTQSIWQGSFNFGYKYDYSAAGARRSVEDSLQRLGVSALDIVFIHDLSPDNADLNGNWEQYFEIAQKGAMQEMEKMKDEGLIKAWGIGVNTIEPIVKTMEVASPDILLSASQYSLIAHEEALNSIFPKAKEKGISIVIGSPFAAGLLAGKQRYLYGGDLPAWTVQKYKSLEKVAQNHGVNLRAAAIQFSAAPDVVSAVIPGAGSVVQAQENAAAFTAVIPLGFWEELKHEKLIAANAPLPVVN